MIKIQTTCSKPSKFAKAKQQHAMTTLEQQFGVNAVGAMVARDLVMVLYIMVPSPHSKGGKMVDLTSTASNTTMETLKTWTVASTTFRTRWSCPTKDGW